MRLIKMEWHKSIMGEIGLAENTNNKGINLDEAQKMRAEGSRLMETWEFLRLIDKDFGSLHFLKKGEYYFTYSNKEYYRAGWLGWFGYDSGFGAVESFVDFALSSCSGVLLVKEDKK